MSFVASAEGAATPTLPPPWYRRVAFWRGLAGMALALALASAIVTAEFSTQFLQRTRHFHRRLNQLSSNLSTMRSEIASADRELAGMRMTAELDDALRRILDAPDARLIRLAAPGPVSPRTGVIAFSPTLHRAAVEIAGLPAPAAGNLYALWWTRGKHDAPLLAARFGLGADGKAALMIALPPAESTIQGAIVATDSRTPAPPPEGTIVLQGAVAPVPVPRARPNLDSVKIKHKAG